MEIVFLWLVFGVLCAMAAGSRGRGAGGWFFLGCLFGPFALVAVLVMQNLKGSPRVDTHVKCPDCRELVLKDARVCKHCGCKLVPQTE
jgi:hypothetical protein